VIFRLISSDVRARACEAIRGAPEGYIVNIKPPSRSLEQNALMWVTLAEISDKVMWHGRRLMPEEWKDVFTASLKRQKVVPGLDGGFVVIGARTSDMSKAEISDVIELAKAFLVERTA
jgi:hypothetical protein